MISDISATLYSKLTRSMTLTEKQYAAGLYGMNGAIYTAFSTAVLVLFGTLLGEFSNTCVVIGVYYLNQTIGGGFHATTHTKCLMTMLVGLAIGIGILKFCVWSVPIAIFMASVGCILMWLIPLVLHKNKRFLETQRRTLICKSRICLICEILLFCIMIVNRHEFSFAFVVGFSLSTVSRVTGEIINARYC